MKVTLMACILFQVEKSLTFHQKVQGGIFIKLILSDFFFLALHKLLVLALSRRLELDMI